jgi:hypothetical protein
MVKKILVTGFAHSGTTVLRAKIGECKNTAECPNESPTPPTFHPEMPFDFYVWNNNPEISTQLEEIINKKTYNYKIILINSKENLAGYARFYLSKELLKN